MRTSSKSMNVTGRNFHIRKGSIQMSQRPYEKQTIRQRGASAEMSPCNASKSPHKQRYVYKEEIKKRQIEEVSTTANITLDVSKGKPRRMHSASFKHLQHFFVKPNSNPQFVRNGLSPTGFKKATHKNFKSPQCRAKARGIKSWQRSLASTAPHVLIQDQYCENEMELKTYFVSKRTLMKKYEDMINTLRTEEASAIDLILSKNPSRLKELIEEIRSDYELTKNLLMQQKVMEEEELIKKYEVVLQQRSGKSPSSYDEP